MPTLYVGGDDSNHAGELQVKEEITVAVFSLLHEDSVVRQFTERNGHSFFESWIQNQNRDYRVTSRKAEHYRHSGTDLPIIIPCLIQDFLAEYNSQSHGNPKIEQINIYLDGILNAELKRALKEDVFHISGIENIVVNNFIKRWAVEKNSGSRKHASRKIHRCPELVYMAHLHANYLFNLLKSNPNTLDLLEPERFVLGNGVFGQL